MALFFGLFGELDDQNGVLRRKTNENDQANIDKDIAIEVAKVTPSIAANMHIGTIRTTEKGNIQLS